MKKPINESPGADNGLEPKSRGRKHAEASFPVPPGREELPDSYAAVLGEIKKRIRAERLRIVMTANAAMVLLYWDIGKAILERQQREGWGAKVIDRLSADLREAFPDMRGLSPRNLKYMRSLAAAWSDRQIVQEVLAQITWYHNIALLEKVADPQVRLWYARKGREVGWSRDFYLDLLLCKSKDRLVVEYALRGFQKPIGVAEWETRLVESLPEELKGSLPTVEEIEAELARRADEA